MNKQFLKYAGAVLLALTGAASWAQDSAPRMPAALGCDKPEWNREAVRYELEGAARVDFDLDDVGQPTNPRIARSSGWKLLDTMSLRAVAKCRYAPPTDPAFRRTGLTLGFHWKLTPPPGEGLRVPAALVAGSCPVSNRFAGFRPLSGDVTGSEGLLVRFLLDAEGKLIQFRTEGEVSRDVYQEAEAYIAACRFTPESSDAKPGPGNLVGRLVPKAA